MDSLLTRSRAQQLDDALATSASPSGAADHLRTELVLVGRLRDAGRDDATLPTPVFREALRTRLMAVAAVQGVGAPTRSLAPARSVVSWRRRTAAVGAGVLASAVAVSGVAVAGSRSLPGDPFYGVKRTSEAVQLRAADEGLEEGTRHLQFAATRLREVRGLVLGRDAPADAVVAGVVPADVQRRIPDALRDMDVDTRTGQRLLVAAFRDSRATAALEQLSRFAVAQDTGLRAMLPALAGTAREQAQESLTLLAGMRVEADEMLMLVDCTSTCDPAQTAPTAPGADASPCGCPSPVPLPRTAPVPPAAPAPSPNGSEPDGTAPEPGTSAGESVSPEPSTGPSRSPSAPQPDSPGLPAPSLPAEPPLAPSGPGVRLPSAPALPNDLLPEPLDR